MYYYGYFEVDLDNKKSWIIKNEADKQITHINAKIHIFHTEANNLEFIFQI